MRYYAQYTDTGKLLAIGTGAGGTEITEAEYNTLLAEIREKAALVDKLYSGEITIPEWVQPDSTNSYSKGDKVTHNGKTWVSDIDNNVWEPGVYVWTDATA